jgi:hypothetical protein
MKIKDINTNNVEDFNNEEDSERIVAQLDDVDLAHIFKILCDQYSNNIGSIVRELTSNCFDAHKALGKDDIVEVGFEWGDEESDIEYVYFKDKGDGMNPDFMKKVYMKWGKSTKRDSNDQIGCFGIGSKSPLSITNQYEIISINNNKKYFYYIYLNNKNLPECDIISIIDTNETNYTKVRIQLEDYSQKIKFKREFENQLLYFTDVYFVNCDINNDYKIYNAKNFVYRVGCSEIAANICYTRVNYPIDFSLLNLSRLPLPIGIKFDIGELRVTPSRESILYETDEINLIRERIKSVCIEIIDKFNSSKNFIYDDYQEYLKNINNYDYVNKEMILNAKVAENYLYDNFGIIHECNNANLKIFKDLNIKLDNKDIDKLLESIVYSPVEIKSSKSYRTDKYLYDSRTIINYKLFKDSNNLYRYNCKLKLDKIKNKYLQNATLISTRDKKQYLYKLKSRNNNISLKNARLLYLFLIDIIKNNTKNYHKVEIPKNFTPIIKKIKSDKISLVIKSSGTIHKFNSIEKLQLLHAEKSNNKFIYKKLIITNSYNFYDNFINLNFMRFHDYYRILTCSNTTYKNILKLKTYKHKNIIMDIDFIKNDKVFRNFCTAFILEDKLEHVQCAKILKDLNDNLLEKYTLLSEFIEKYNTTISYYNKSEFKIFKEECISIAKSKNLFNFEIISYYKEIKKYVKGLELLEFIKHEELINNPKCQQQVVKFIKLKNKRLNKDKYNILKNTWETELIEDSCNKIDYKESINI